MKRINILVDATGSMNVDATNNQLLRFRESEEANVNEITVCIYSMNIEPQSSLKYLEIPLVGSSGMGLDSGPIVNFMKGQLSSSPDIFIFIGDFMESAISKKILEGKEKTTCIFIDTGTTNENVSVFARNIIHQSNVHIGNVSDNLTLKDILKLDLSSKINLFRENSAENNANASLKPT